MQSSRVHASRFCFLVLLVGSLCAPPVAIGATIGLNFTGITLQQGAILNGNSGYAPPDNNGAVGGNYVVQLINGAFAVYDKTTGAPIQLTGAPAGQQAISGRQFWINAGFDPGNNISNLGAFNGRIIFDPTTQRWIAAELSAQPTNNQVMIARSNTSDPTGGWQSVHFTGSDGVGGDFADFTRLGIDANGVYVSTNNFTENSADAGLSGVSVFSMPKADLLQNSPTIANLSRFDGLGDLYGWTVQPIIDFGPAKDHAPLLGTQFSASATNLIRSNLFGTNGPNATITADQGTPIPVNQFFFPPAAGQPDGTHSIGTLDSRMMASVVEVNGIIYSVLTTMVGNKAAIQWFKINEATNQVLQQGTLSDPNFDYFQPSIAANSNGDVVIGFTRSGLGAGGNLSDFAIVAKTVGGVTTFGTPMLLKASAVGNYHYINGRWGDWSTTIVDPSNPNVFWTFQEYATASNAWATQITQILVPEPSSIVLAMLALGALSLAAWRRQRAVK